MGDSQICDSNTSQVNTKLGTHDDVNHIFCRNNVNQLAFDDHTNTWHACLFLRYSVFTNTRPDRTERRKIQHSVSNDEASLRICLRRFCHYDYAVNFRDTRHDINFRSYPQHLEVILREWKPRFQRKKKSKIFFWGHAACNSITSLKQQVLLGYGHCLVNST